MNCRAIRVYGMVAAVMIGGLMMNTAAQAQAGAEKAKAKAMDSTSAQPPLPRFRYASDA